MRQVGGELSEELSRTDDLPIQLQNLRLSTAVCGSHFGKFCGALKMFEVKSHNAIGLLAFVGESADRN